MSVSSPTFRYPNIAYASPHLPNGSVEFLSVLETLQLHLQWALSGVTDASRWDVVLQVIKDDPEIRANVLKSTLLNSLSLVVIYTFDLILVPLLGLKRSQLDLDEFAPQHWLHRNIGVFYTLLFQLPVVMLALYLNSTWSGVVTKRVYALQHGRSASAASDGESSRLTTLSSGAYRAILILSSLVLSFVLSYIPIVGGLASFFFMCWVDAYYCFEFVLIARGHSLAARLQEEEERWSYFVAFGIPSAALCMWGSSLANAAIFALMFPAFVIMAIHAHPMPAYPHNPLPPKSEGTAMQMSPSVPIRLPIFAAPLMMHDIALHIIRQVLRWRNGQKISIWRDTYLRRSELPAMEGVEEGTRASAGPSWNPNTRARVSDHGPRLRSKKLS